MSGEDGLAEAVMQRVLRARGYRTLDPALVERIARDEARRGSRGGDAEVAKRVKRRLHQAVGAYAAGRLPADDLAAMAAAWDGSLDDPALRRACRTLLVRHASTRERLPVVEAFYAPLWRLTDGVPSTLLDLGCGLHPLSLPWMGLVPGATYHAVDADAAQLHIVDRALTILGVTHTVTRLDLAAEAPPPLPAADVALLLKLVPLLDRQDPSAAVRLLRALAARHAVVSFPARSLGGRGKGMERTNRGRLQTLLADLGPRVTAVAEASVPGELVFVLTLAPRADG